MATIEVVLQGAVTADGQLVLDEPPDLPPGRVEVIVRSAETAPSVASTLLEVLEPIWARLDAGGFEGGRTLEEAVADVRALRDEWGARDRRIEEHRARVRGAREADEQGPRGS